MDVGSAATCARIASGAAQTHAETLVKEGEAQIVSPYLKWAGVAVVGGLVIWALTRKKGRK